mmetsp:Transcript_48231/g.153993  ORF Transcript_48231/g.153993 Transcript_48231/m.153993 type:complete len:210 (-) Transcript_48231:252-881(-)
MPAWTTTRACRCTWAALRAARPGWRFQRPSARTTWRSVKCSTCYWMACCGNSRSAFTCSSWCCHPTPRPLCDANSSAARTPCPTTSRIRTPHVTYTPPWASLGARLRAPFAATGHRANASGRRSARCLQPAWAPSCPRWLPARCRARTGQRPHPTSCSAQTFLSTRISDRGLWNSTKCPRWHLSVVTTQPQRHAKRLSTTCWQLSLTRC